MSQQEIRDLVSRNSLPEVLTRLAPIYPDAVLLQAQYNQGEKQYSMGLIDFKSSWKVQK